MNMDDTYIDIVIRWYSDYNGGDVHKYMKDQLKTSLHKGYYVFIALYCTLGVLGLIGCLGVLWTIIKKRRNLLADPTYIFMACLALYGTLMMAVVLPLTLSTVILPTWILGQVACTLYPIIQTFPIFASFLTFMAIFIERYSRACLEYSGKMKVRAVLSSWTSAIVSGFLALSMTIPFSFHIKYVHLANVLGSEFSGMALCSVDTEHEEMRKIHLASLILVYGLCAILPVGLGILLRSKFYKRRRRQDIEMLLKKEHGQDDGGVIYSGAVRYGSHIILRTHEELSLTNTPEYIELKENVLTMKYLQTMQLTYVLCWLPAALLTIDHQLDHRIEGRDSGELGDFIHLIVYFIGFLSPVTNTVIFWIWQRALKKLSLIQRRSCVQTVM